MLEHKILLTPHPGKYRSYQLSAIQTKRLYPPGSRMIKRTVPAICLHIKAPLPYSMLRLQKEKRFGQIVSCFHYTPPLFRQRRSSNSDLACLEQYFCASPWHRRNPHCIKLPLLLPSVHLRYLLSINMSWMPANIFVVNQSSSVQGHLSARSIWHLTANTPMAPVKNFLFVLRDASEAALCPWLRGDQQDCVSHLSACRGVIVLHHATPAEREALWSNGMLLPLFTAFAPSATVE